MATTLDAVQWIHGAANCAATTDPLLQVHQFDPDTFIIRQSKCSSFEGPFMYVLFGDRRAILFDTGAHPDGPSAPRPPIRATIDRAIEERGTAPGAAPLDLIVAHTHSHGDHVSGDPQFSGRPHTTIVGHDLSSIQSFYGLPHWPDGQATLDLGGRALTVLPLPGHEATHIAVYDARTQILLTGDTLYPGLLTVRAVAAYRRSAERLAAFAADHPVSLVLGNHIEMTRTARAFFPVGTTFQPGEHVLPLTAAHLEEWRSACETLDDSPHQDVHDDFIIEVL